MHFAKLRWLNSFSRQLMAASAGGVLFLAGLLVASGLGSLASDRLPAPAVGALLVGLPLAIAYAYAVARFAGASARHALGLAGVVVLQVVVLIQDASTGGLDALSVGLPLAALAYGAGLLVQSRVARKGSAPTLADERVRV